MIMTYENAIFVVDRDKLKCRDDWLVADVGSFINEGNAGKVFTIEEGLLQCQGK